ncbi:MAG: hypothetical protein ABIL09_11200 [Gemmatimonadota bacterium]
MPHRRRVRRAALAMALVAMGSPAMGEGRVLFAEPFEDTRWSERGWYDAPRMEVVLADDAPQGRGYCVWHWRSPGDVVPAGGGARVQLPSVTDVGLSFHVRHDSSWTWTGRGWHPHMFHFVTDADDPYVGPAHTHLTFYVEAVDGVPRLAIQDGRNIDEDRVGEDLTTVTEARSVAGCNGDSDGHGEGDCYPTGEHHANGKYWETQGVWFASERGPRYMADWHHIQARFRLNSVVDGTAVRDGLLQYWYDGALIVDHHDVVFRTGEHAEARINQFLMTPYYGPGVPHEQRMWIDDLRIYEGTPETGTGVGESPGRPAWGRIKANQAR